VCACESGGGGAAFVKGVLRVRSVGEECGKLNSVQRVFKGGSKKLWRGEALNEFVADPHRHTEREREREREV
jgi:hypothetical protein